MIQKLKRRYLITNMALLSGTLLVCLAVLFGFLYHAEISFSYSVMQEMIQDTKMPDSPEMQESAEPTLFQMTPEHIPLDNQSSDCECYNWKNEQNASSDAENDSDNPHYSNREYLDGNTSESSSDQNNYWQPPGQYIPSDNNQYWNPNPQQPQWPVYPWPVYPWPVYPWPVYPWMVPNNPDWQWDPNQHPDITTPEQPNTTPSEPAYTEPQKPEPDIEHNPEHSKQPEIPQEPEIQPQKPLQTKPHDTEHNHETHSETCLPETNRSETSRTEAEDQTSNQSSTQTTTVPLASAPIVSSEIQMVPQLVPVQEGQYIPDAFIAELDHDGNIASYSSNHTNTSDGEQFNTVHHAINEVKRRGSNAGVIEVGDTSYRFMYKPDDAGNLRLVLLNRTLEISTLNRLLFIFLLITVLGLLLMFGISNKLANWTVQPTAIAWEKQKQFVADASHELKTPLAVISANTEVILANPHESVADQNKWLSYIQSETMRMSKLVSNLLSVARMDNTSGKTDTLGPLPLSETVSNICLLFEPIIYENGKTLNTVIQRNVMLIAEEDNIKQLLSILLDNAILHSLPKAQITVSLSKDVQGKIRLSVANTAKDIPQEQLAHLFDRFYRLDRESSPNGSGLGLSIARSIVRQMGGTLQVTSENQLVTFVAVFAS